jgi:alpha-mannosidase
VADAEFVESRRRQRVVLYEGIKRIDLHLELDWRGKPDAALYLQMPNMLMNGRKFIDVPFAVHRDGNELMDYWIDESLPIKFKLRGIQDWICFEDGGRGFAIATRWPMIDFTLVPSFPLMWTNNDSGFFFGERYLQKGKHNFSFSLTSYKGNWLENGIHRWGKQWSKPLLSVIGQTKPIEPSQSYLSVEPDNIVVSAVKKAHDEDAIVVRLYEIAGKETDARLQTVFPVKRATLTNLIETASHMLASQTNSVKISFRPFEIKTIKLYL